MSPGAEPALGSYVFLRGEWRRWNGRRFVRVTYAARTARLRDPRPFDDDPPLDPQVRERLLFKAISLESAHGGRLVLRSTEGVAMAYPREPDAMLMMLVPWWLRSTLRETAARRTSWEQRDYEIDAWGNVWPLLMTDHHSPLG